MTLQLVLIIGSPFTYGHAHVCALESHSCLLRCQKEDILRRLHLSGACQGFSNGPEQLARASEHQNDVILRLLPPTGKRAGALQTEFHAYAKPAAFLRCSSGQFSYHRLSFLYAALKLRIWSQGRIC